MAAAFWWATLPLGMHLPASSLSKRGASHNAVLHAAVAQRRQVLAQRDELVRRVHQHRVLKGAEPVQLARQRRPDAYHHLRQEWGSGRPGGQAGTRVQASGHARCGWAAGGRRRQRRQGSHLDRVLLPLQRRLIALAVRSLLALELRLVGGKVGRLAGAACGRAGRPAGRPTGALHDRAAPRRAGGGVSGGGATERAVQAAWAPARAAASWMRGGLAQMQQNRQPAAGNRRSTHSSRPTVPHLLPNSLPASDGARPSMTHTLPPCKVVLLARLPAELCAHEFHSEWVARHQP